jgi:hypothetical protein
MTRFLAYLFLDMGAKDLMERARQIRYDKQTSDAQTASLKKTSMAAVDPGDGARWISKVG